MGNQTSMSMKTRLEENEKRLSKINRGKETVESSKNAQMIMEKFVQAYNLRDKRTFESTLAPGASFAFKGADTGIPLDLFLEQVEMVQESFPDVCVSFEKIYEPRDGVVKVTNFHSRGTHTGKPFGYGPFPAISATGTVVEEGPCQFTFLVSGGKISHFEIEMPEGDITGPPGYYHKIGGKMALVQ